MIVKMRTGSTTRKLVLKISGRLSVAKRIEILRIILCKKFPLIDLDFAIKIVLGKGRLLCPRH